MLLSELSIFLDEAEGERNLPSWNPSLLRFQIPMPGMANVGYDETEKYPSRQAAGRFSYVSHVPFSVSCTSHPSLI